MISETYAVQGSESYLPASIRSPLRWQRSEAPGSFDREKDARAAQDERCTSVPFNGGLKQIQGA
jgi:hypothetical protein